MEATTKVGGQLTYSWVAKNSAQFAHVPTILHYFLKGSPPSMNAKSPTRLSHTLVAAVAAAVAAVGALTTNEVSLAQQLPPAAESVEEALAKASLADLEKAFWACDYRATTHGVHATPVEICATATSELKRLKFGGSFDELLAWWRQNKIAQHQALEQSALAAPWER
jgi:hypothetical protein